MRGLVIAASLIVTTGLWAADATKADESLQNSARVLHEIMSTPDKGIPQDLLDKAECVIAFPSVMKAAFIVGGQYGKGWATCRRIHGTGWGAPAAMKIEGGSVGFQIGGEATDLVLLVMNRHGMESLLGDKVTLGADASVAAGPVGRSANANTDLKLNAEMLAWSRAKGVFAGIALNGATLRPDVDRNEKLYGRKMHTREILMSNMTPPAAAHPLIAELDRYSMRSNNADRSIH